MSVSIYRLCVDGDMWRIRKLHAVMWALSAHSEVKSYVNLECITKRLPQIGDLNI